MNNTTMRVKICAAATTIITALTLTACGTNAATDQPSSTPTATVETKKPQSLSQALSQKGRMWFIASEHQPDDTFGKDTQIAYVLISAGDDKVLAYDTGCVEGRIQVKDLKGLSRDEIVALAKKEAEKEYAHDVQADSSYGAKVTLDDAVNPKPIPYELSVKTDNTGNATEGEDFIIPERSGTGLQLAAPMRATLIYDMLFAGFLEDGGRPGIFTMIEKGEPEFVMDQPDTPGIKIDD